ncbi:hypothetical protein [Ralstonia sp. 24A2]|uniref:hypothetical protein n=1 Tax=Ralstonia sp. 24A2 TaxID=3447364 RepID=UPI003F6A05C4
MNPHPRATVHSPNQRDEPSANTTPPRAPDAGPIGERVDRVLGKPEHDHETPAAAPGTSGCLPHERDQRLDEQRSGPRANIEQAARDIESGQLDTDLHNTPGIERVVRERCTANREDRDRQVANHSADELADKRGDAGKPSRSSEHQR